jgi:hypothetical protein
LTGWSRRDTLIRTGKNPTTIQQGFDMTTKLPYIGYDKPLTESNSIFSYGERLENGTRSFMKIIKKNYNDRSKAFDTIIEVWQVDLTDLACTVADDPEWQEFMEKNNRLNENDMLDLLDATGYETEYFEEDPNLLREYASNEGYLQRDDGLFYKVSDKK